ncbi:MAG TPA: hypothetical protein VIT43_00685 [Candidatus Dormibacteraeota bacterium]
MAGSEDDKRREPSEEGNPSTASSEQASRWVAVYDELLEMETSVIESVRARLIGMSSEARRITERTNLPQLENDAASFRSRLALWRDRLAQLEG